MDGCLVLAGLLLQLRRWVVHPSGWVVHPTPPLAHRPARV
jgi:hypothetical protein